MKIYIVEKDANSHYGVTQIDKVFLNKKDAENYKKKIDSIQVREYKECQKGYPDRFDEFERSINEVNEVWITEYDVAQPSLTLKQAIKKAKPNMDKIKDVDKHINNIR